MFSVHSGNPLKWHNASSLTWEGRKLKTFTKTDGTVISYTYDENGIRTGKKIGSENVEYVLSGSKIIQEKRTGYTLTFLYNTGKLVGFNYKAGTTNADYYYGIDNFGNINYIYDNNGNIVTMYKYDAWGNILSTTGSLASTIGTINPYRYKSYYYDQEITMYYLQSRYYDATIQRFLNEDDVVFLGAGGTIYSYNLYIYCNNDGINSVDVDGHFFFTAIFAWLAGEGAVYVIGSLILLCTVVLMPGFQQAWEQMCTSIAGAIDSVLDGLTGVTDSVSEWLKTQAQDVARKIDEALSKVQNKSKYQGKEELHHIIAKSARKAAPARNVLYSLKLTPNYIGNLISLKKMLHKHLHYSVYYDYVNAVVLEFQKSAPGTPRERLDAALLLLRSFLEVLNEAAPG